MSKVAITIMAGVLTIGIGGCSTAGTSESKSTATEETGKEVVHKQDENETNVTNKEGDVETAPTTSKSNEDNQGEDTEVSTKESDNKQTKSETPSLLTEAQIKKMLDSNMDSIFDAFDNAGEKYGWGTSKPAVFSKLSPSLTEYATDSFINNDLKSLATNYYCECDEHFKPDLNMDVRFSYEQNGKELKIVALEPATEMLNMGSTWDFTYVFEDGKWKINYWKAKSLEHNDLKLTKSEAEKLLSDYGDKAEYDGAVATPESDGAKAYVYRIFKDGKALSAIGVSSKNTKLIYDFDAEFSIDDDSPSSTEDSKPQEDSSEETKQDDSQSGSSDTDKNNNISTLGHFNIYNEYLNIEVGSPDDNMHFHYKTTDLVSKFGKPVAIASTSNVVDYQYSDAIYSIAQSTGEVYKVTITGSKAASYYADFDTIKKVYEGDGVYGAFDQEETNDGEGYHLVFDNYSTARHVYTSDNQNGSPIKKIVVELTDY